MSNSRKKYERIEKKAKKVHENTRKRQLKKNILSLIKRNKNIEAGLLIQKYKTKYGDINDI